MRKLLVGALLATATLSNAQNIGTVVFDDLADGSLAGQGTPGFFVQSSDSSSHVVGPSAFALGTKDVSIDTAPLGGGSWAWQDFTGYSHGAGNTIVVAQVMGTIEVDPLDRGSSFVGIDAYQAPFARMATIGFYGNGGGFDGEVDFFTGDNGENYFVHPTLAPVCGNTYQLTLVMDTAAGMACGFFNDEEVQVTTPFPMTAWTGGASFTDADLFTFASGYNMCHYDNLTIDAVAPGTIRGKVTLQDWGGAVAGQGVAVEIRDSTGSSVLDTQYGTLDADGVFNVTTSVRGAVTIAVKGTKWLNRLRTTVSNLTDFGVYGLSYSLTDGDVNNDNAVDIGDYSILSAAYGTFLGDAGYDDAADLNGDEAIDIGDYSILSSNYGQFGD